MFDHLSVGVADLERAAAFYDTALAPLGFVRLARSARSVSYGRAGFTGADEGAPGIRASYDPGYYAAFVRDLDGYRLEAVVHLREPGAP